MLLDALSHLHNIHEMKLSTVCKVAKCSHKQEICISRCVSVVE